MANRITLLLISILVSFPLLGTAQTTKPVSVSYENILRCFPALFDEQNSFKVDLNRFKELVDQRFVTSQSQLRQRKVQYLDLDRKSMNLILRTNEGVKPDTELIVQQVDSKGVITDVKLPANQRINPKQDTINNFLLGATIQSDVYTFNDTKLNNMVSSYVRNFKDVQEYTLKDQAGTRVVFCEKKSDLGIICTCTKK